MLVHKLPSLPKAMYSIQSIHKPARSTIDMKRKHSAEKNRVQRRRVSKAEVPQTNVTNDMDTAQRIAKILEDLYPNPEIPLQHSSNFQLLVAVLLSAQTTDKKVNQVTPALFQKAPDVFSMAQLSEGEIEEIIKGVGLGKSKAANICKLSKQLIEQHNGVVPSSFEELESLAGVGHKTASVVMCQAFGLPSFPVDTHIHRLAKRWGLTANNSSVKQTEDDLKRIFPEDTWSALHLRMIYFGREYCSAKKHDVEQCLICKWVTKL
eukprot:TRINITY_DN5694_c2_g1_i3.p1 TRINITY_DN5694_c2_g1~~TRINITY_DN5694_c2_g1_i3.p1  ORF type:complete len:264 (+),score=17.05 TRINITY_DN5694_c2_g1_i3:808-1599(+)